MKHEIIIEIDTDMDTAFDDHELIRCHDCEYWGLRRYDDIKTCFMHCDTRGNEQVMDPDSFCSWAKRRRDI